MFSRFCEVGYGGCANDPGALAVGRALGGERMYRAPNPRERERWHAIWLLLRGWSAAQVADALERDAHTIGDWLDELRQHGPKGLVFEIMSKTIRPVDCYVVCHWYP